MTPLLSGEATGGAGRYSVNFGEQATASVTVSGTYGIVTLGATPTGQVPIGALISASGYSPTATAVTAYISGNGTTTGNTLALNNTTTNGSNTVTYTTNVATKFAAMSGGAAGELIKISSWVLG